MPTSQLTASVETLSAHKVTFQGSRTDTNGEEGGITQPRVLGDGSVATGWSWAGERPGLGWVLICSELTAQDHWVRVSQR